VAAELGGAVLSAAMDTPFGRLATLADPMGAATKVIARTAG
jgi:predicted enzyme related to lactoylglutathione lyase